MTTTVIVEAHCAENKEVVIDLGFKNPESTTQQITIQDGERWQGVVFDNKVIAVYERLKS